MKLLGGITEVRLVVLVSLLTLFICLPGQASSADYEGYFAPELPPATNYQIVLDYDMQAGKFTGTEWITVSHCGGRDISQLVISWPWGLPADYQVCDAIGISSVGRLSENTSLLEFDPPLTEDRDLTIEIEFWFTAPPEYKGMLMLSDWYPRLDWGYKTLDNYQLQFVAPDGYNVLTSAVEVEPGRYAAEDIRSFGVILTNSMDVVSRQAGGVSISALYTPETEKCARFVVDTAVDVIEFYIQMHRFYPQKTLAIIPGASDPMGGYPVDSGIVCIHGQGKMGDMPLSHWQFVTAHEIGHQYWMEYVLEAPRAKWVMIGLGVYADREYMLSRGNGDEHEREMMDRYIEGMSEHHHTHMDLSDTEKRLCGFDYNNVVTHGKGFGLISSLACYLGKERFEKVYTGCLREYHGRMLNQPEFQRYCELTCQEDLDWFFEQWVFTNNHLYYETDLIGQHETGEGFEYIVKASNLGTMEMPVPVDAFFTDGTRQRRFTSRLAPETLLTFTSASELTEVVLDADGEMPLLNVPLEYDVDELKERIAGFGYLSGQSTRMWLLMDQPCLEEIKDPWTWLKIGMLLYEGEYYDEMQRAFSSGLECTEEDWQYPFLAWLGITADMQGQRERAIEYYRKAMERMEDDAYIRHDQFGIIVNKQWLEERLSTPFPGVRH